MSIEHEIEVFENFLHVRLDNCTINIIRTDFGVVVDVWEKDFEGAEPVASTYAFDEDLRGDSNHELINQERRRNPAA